MLTQRLHDHVEPLLEPGEEIGVAMAGFRPLTRSWSFYAVILCVLLGFAISSAAEWPAWLAGGIGGGVGAGLAVWLDQRQARREHDGKGISIGLVVTDRRFFLLELSTGPIRAAVAAIERVVPLADVRSISVERMQGSGLKRPGAVIALADGSELRVIPARVTPFVEAIERSPDGATPA